MFELVQLTCKEDKMQSKKTAHSYQKTKPQKASLGEVAEFLDANYSTVVRWDKRKKECLRYGLPVLKQILKLD